MPRLLITYHLVAALVDYSCCSTVYFFTAVVVVLRTCSDNSTTPFLTLPATPDWRLRVHLLLTTIAVFLFIHHRQRCLPYSSTPTCAAGAGAFPNL